MTERIDPIVIEIRYDYIDDNLKKASRDIQSFSTSSTDGIEQVTKKFSSLKDVYKNMQSSLTRENSKIAASMKAVENSMESAQKALQSVVSAKAAGTSAIANYSSLVRELKSKGGTYMSDKGGIISAFFDGEQDEAWSRRLTSAWSNVITSTSRAKNAMTSYRQSVQSVANASQSLIQKQNEYNYKLQQTQNIIQKITSKARGLRSALSAFRFVNLYSMLNIAQRLGRAVLSFVEESSSWIENLNLLESVFKETSDAAIDFVNMAASNFGLDANALVEYVATFRQMANAMGQAAETGTQLSEVLTLIALDVSSLRNVEIATVISDFTSALAGQVKPVRKYGFDITMYSIDELMEELGFGSMSRTMSQADKQLARAILLIRQSQDAWGDLGKTINTFANQQRVLQDQFNTTLRLLGNVALGTFKFTDSLEEAWKTAGMATQAIWVLNGAIMAANQIFGILAPSTEDLGITSIATESETAIDALEDLESAAKSSLADFDKFNVLNQGSTGTKTSDALRASLEALLNSEYEKYMEQYEQRLGQIDSYAKDIAATILNLIFPGYKEWYDLAKEAGRTDLSLDLFGQETGTDVQAYINNFGDLAKGILGIVGVVLFLAKPLAGFISTIGILAIKNEDFLKTLVEISEAAQGLILDAGNAFARLIETSAPIIKIVIEISSWFLKMLDSVDATSYAVYALISAMIAFKAIKIVASIAQLVSTFKQLGITIQSVGKIAMASSIILMISMLAELIINWDNLSEAGKAFRIVLIGIAAGFGIVIPFIKTMTSATTLAGAQISSTLSKAQTSMNAFARTAKNAFSSTATSIALMGSALIALGGAVAQYIISSKNMTESQKAMIPAITAVVAVLTGVAIAIAAASAGPLAAIKAAVTGAALAASITMTALTTKANLDNTAKFAEGGFISGGLFNAGEKGPEWVGRQGKSAVIVNDSQMSDIMEESVARGVMRAYNNPSLRSAQNGSQNGRTTVIQVDGRKFLKVVEDEGKKVGKVFARA